MLPNIDSVQIGAATGGGQAQAKRETDLIVNKPSEIDRGAARDAEVAEKGGKVERADSAAAVEKKKAASNARAAKDEAQITFRVTPEERDALVAAFSGRDSAQSMTKEEKNSLKGAAERITKVIEEAAAKSSAGRERTEKALSEWYNRLSKGETPPEEDIITLLRKAAMGAFDDMYN